MGFQKSNANGDKRIMEIMIPVRTELRDHILRQEWQRHVQKIQETPTNDVEGRYDQMGEIGKILKEFFHRENHARVKAFENPEMIKFLKKFIGVAKRRAKEMGYFYKDIEVSKDSGITKDGHVLIKFVPISGAKKVL